MSLYHEVKNASLSLFTSIITIHSFQRIAGWLAETAGACASAVVVAVSVYFVMRWVEKTWPKKKQL